MTLQQRHILLAGAFLIAVLQIVKGLSVEANLYPVMTSIFTYADGPVRRGLLPSLLAGLGMTSLADIGRAYVMLHLVGLALFVLLLLWRLQQLLSPPHAAPLILTLLLIASPVLPTLAATTGYSDIWLVLLLMATNSLLKQGHFIAAAGLVLVGTLQHEIMLVLALPLLVAHGWLQPEQRTRILLSAACLAALAAAWLVVAGLYQPLLIPVAEARCAALRPEGHALLATVWDPYCVRHVKATLLGDLRPERLILLPAFWLVYGLFPLTLVVAGLGRIHEGMSRAQAVIFVALGFVPYALIMLAWDSDRFILLSAVVGLLVLDSWYEAVPSTQKPTPRGQILLGGFILFQLLLAYPSANIYGVSRVLSPTVSEKILLDARGVLTPLISNSGLKWPAMLDPATCIDLRCVK